MYIYVTEPHFVSCFPVLLFELDTIVFVYTFMGHSVSTQPEVPAQFFFTKARRKSEMKANILNATDE